MGLAEPDSQPHRVCGGAGVGADHSSGVCKHPGEELRFGLVPAAGGSS